MITHQKNYSLYRLYNSNATNPPNICAKLYDTISFVGRPPQLIISDEDVNVTLNWFLRNFCIYYIVTV